MIDIKILRKNKKCVVQNLKKRKFSDIKRIDEILAEDLKWRKLKKDLDNLKAEKNKKSKSISSIKKEEGDISEIHLQIKEISLEMNKKILEEKKILKKRDDLLFTIPCLLDDEVPSGINDCDNVSVRLNLKKPKYNFEIRSHMEICLMNNWYDLETAAKHSGARFYYTKNELVELELALYNFVIQKLIKKNYTILKVPPMLKSESAKKVIPLTDFDDLVYTVEDGDSKLFLIGTSEATIALMHSDQTLSHKELPKRYCALSSCFRRESGVTKDDRGIFRVHHFDKIEQFVYCEPKDSDKLLKEILGNCEEIFKELDLHYHIVDICVGDLGMFAARKFDLEAYLPFQDRYREMGSASNYRDFGARRVNCKFQNNKGETNFLHTLNSTAIACPRILIAIIEQFQTKDGNVKIPKVLKKYLGGRDLLKK